MSDDQEYADLAWHAGSSQLDLTTTALPREVQLVRQAISRALRQADPERPGHVIGAAKFGVYAFYDYDGEPIYVGQTREGFSARLGRHLTGQRSDAVAKYVLDPFEVHSIALWSVPVVGDLPSEERKAALDAFEYTAYAKLLEASAYGAVLNEGTIRPAKMMELPDPVRAIIVPEEIYADRAHPDVRIARRAVTISLLAKNISERQVSMGLRRTLLTQAQRLQDLAQRRVDSLDGATEVTYQESDIRAGDAD